MASRIPALRRRSFVSEQLESRRLFAAIVWDGGPTGLGTAWENPVNWVGDIKPTAADDAIINTAGPTIIISTTETLASITSSRSLSQTAGTLSLTNASTTSGYSMSAGTLTGTGDLTITSSFSWSAGTMAAGGKTIIASTATGTISSGSSKGLNRTFDNSGALNYTGTQLIFGLSAAVPGILNNLVGGQFNITTTGGFSQSSAAAHAFNNAGTLNKSGGASTFTNVEFNNTGNVNVATGTLSLANGFSSGGFSIDAAATLDLTGNRNHFAGSITGDGTTTVSAGNTTFAANTIASALSVTSGTARVDGANNVPSLTLTGGFLAGLGDLAITSTLNWSAGTMAAGGKTILASTGTGTISGGSSKGLNRTFDNAGTLNYTGTQLIFGLSAAVPGILNNLAAGVFNVTTTGGFSQSSAAAHAFNNAGTLNKSGGASTFTNVAFNNTGTVNVDTGTLSLVGGTSTGIFSIDAGATLDLNGTRSHTAGSTTGSGATNISGGSITFAAGAIGSALAISAGTVTLNGANSVPSLTLSGGTLAGTGNLTVTSALNWSAGTMADGARTILGASSTSSITGGSTKGLNRTLDNSGTITYSGSQLAFGLGNSVPGIINNLAGATFIAASDGDFVRSNISAHAFNNAGTFQKAGVNTTTSFTGVTFNHTGTASVLSGSLVVGDGNSSTASFSVSAAATLRFSATHTISTISGLGAVAFDAGSFDLTTPNAVSVSTIEPVPGGVTLNLLAAQSFTNFSLAGGTITGPANLNITSTFNWSSGTLTAGGKLILGGSSTTAITSASTKGLNRTLDNSGTITYSGSQLVFGFGAAAPGIINNLAGATFIASSDGDITRSSTAAHAFNNAGTFQKTGAGTTTIFTGVTFNHTGTVSVLSGSLSVADGSSSTATYSVSAAAALRFTTTHAISTISGLGTVAFDAGTFDLTTPNAVTVPTIEPIGSATTLNLLAPQSFTSLSLTGGTITGPANLNITSTFNWSSGTLAAGGKLILGDSSTTSITSSSTKGLNRTLDNSGTITYSGSQIIFGLGATAPGIINNLASATFIASSDGDITRSNASAHAFNNAGTFQKTGAGTTTSFTGVTFNHTGTVSVLSGTLSLADGDSSTATYSVSAGATLRFSATHAISTISGLGTVAFEAGNFDLTTPNAVSVTNIEPIGSATLNLLAPQSFTSLSLTGGTITGPANLTLTSGFNWSSGTLAAGGKLILGAGSTSTITSNSTKGLNRTLDNSGSLTYSGSQLIFGFGATVPGVINNLAGATLAVTNGGDFTRSFAAAHALNNAGTINISGGDTVLNAVDFTSTAGSLSIASGSFTLAPVPASTLLLDSLTLGATASFATANHSLIVNYPSTSQIASYIAAAAESRLTSADSFLGLPTNLAISEAADLGLTEFNGTPIDDTTTLLKYTYVGDANLDGQVDALDYERIDLAIGNTGVLGTAQGDLNYDGNVDALDYEQVDLNIGNGVGSPLASITTAPTTLANIFSQKKIRPTANLW
jgi:hypothetical protein